MTTKIIRGTRGRTTYKIRENYFDFIDDENKSYILGLLYADGNNQMSPLHTITLQLQEGDKKILEKIRDLVFISDRPLAYVKSGKMTSRGKEYIRQASWSLRICNKHISYKLNDWGLVENKTYKILMPNFLNNKLIRHFIRGYLDGDGCISYTFKKNQKGESLYKDFTVGMLSNETFCRQLREIIKKNTGINGNVVRAKNIFRYQIGGNTQANKLLKWLYDDAHIFLQRKYEVYLELVKQVNLTLKSRYSKYRHVTYDKNVKKYVAWATVNSKSKFIGLFKSERKAHLAYVAFEKSLQDAHI